MNEIIEDDFQLTRAFAYDLEVGQEFLADLNVLQLESVDMAVTLSFDEDMEL